MIINDTAVRQYFKSALPAVQDKKRIAGIKKRKRTMPPQSGLTDERRVCTWLRRYIPNARPAQHGEKGDIICGSKHVEVKSCRGRNKGEWGFNLQRHGVLDETDIDAYILRLDNVPGFERAIHLVLPAPFRRSTITITLRSLMTYWGRFFNRTDYIMRVQKTSKEVNK